MSEQGNTWPNVYTPITPEQWEAFTRFLALEEGAMREKQQATRLKRWWAVAPHDLTVVEVIGHECQMDNSGIWWVPSLGSTMLVGYSLFETEAEARVAAVRAWTVQIRRYDEAIRRILGSTLGKYYLRDVEVLLAEFEQNVQGNGEGG